MNQFLEIIQRIPWFVAGLWLVWLVATGALVKVTTKYSRTDAPSAEERIKSLEQHAGSQDAQLAAILQAVNNIRPIQIGTLALPNPDPQQHVDWRTAMIDVSGVNDIRQVNPDQMSRLFTTVDDRDALVNVVREGKVTIEALLLTNPNPPGRKVAGAKYLATIVLRSNLQRDLRATVPKGQIFENLQPKSSYQNLAASDAQEILLPAMGTITAQIVGYCFNHGKLAPANQPGNLSPLRVRFAFSGQNELWDRTEAIIAPFKK